jgi:hypothetical protein
MNAEVAVGGEPKIAAFFSVHKVLQPLREVYSFVLAGYQLP